MITESDLEDFEQCIIEANLFVDDFKLTEQTDAPDTKEVTPWTVMVTYTPTGAARSYQAEPVSTWPDEFQRDLKLNKFQTR